MRKDFWVGHDHLVRVWEPNAVEAQLSNSLCYHISMLDVESRWNEEFVASPIPVDLGKLDALVLRVENMAATGT